MTGLVYCDMMLPQGDTTTNNFIVLRHEISVIVLSLSMKTITRHFYFPHPIGKWYLALVFCYITRRPRCMGRDVNFFFKHLQGSHRLEKYLNLEVFFKSPWKFNLPWKVLENHSKALKSPWILLFSVGLSTVDRDLNQYKIVVPLFGAANAAPNKGTTISYSFSSTNFSIISV